MLLETLEALTDIIKQCAALIQEQAIIIEMHQIDTEEMKERREQIMRHFQPGGIIPF